MSDKGDIEEEVELSSDGNAFLKDFSEQFDIEAEVGPVVLEKLASLNSLFQLGIPGEKAEGKFSSGEPSG